MLFGIVIRVNQVNCRHSGGDQYDEITIVDRIESNTHQSR